MTTPPDKEKHHNPLHGLLVFSVEDRALFLFVIALFTIAVVGVGVLGFLGVHTANRVDKNSKAIARQANRGTELLRRADARICARENLVRAEVHVAYQSGQPMPTPERFASEPILQVLLDGARQNQENGLKRVRRNLPILECSPNLKGRAAYALPDEKQKRFVTLYEKGKLDPTPSALDAQTGPDE